jgi:hypothetical protein
MKSNGATSCGLGVPEPEKRREGRLSDRSATISGQALTNMGLDRPDSCDGNWRIHSADRSRVLCVRRRAGADIKSAARTTIPYAVVLVMAVLLFAFVPEITLVLPRCWRDMGRSWLASLTASAPAAGLSPRVRFHGLAW